MKSGNHDPKQNVEMVDDKEFKKIVERILREDIELQENVAKI
jgi:hypothetical protein